MDLDKARSPCSLASPHLAARIRVGVPAWRRPCCLASGAPIRWVAVPAPSLRCLT